MQNIIKSIIGLCIILMIAISCSKEQKKTELVNLGDENNYIVIADTIINDVIIKNPDNDEWVDYSLRNLKKEVLVNKIFDSVYEGKLIPYEFFNNTQLSIKDIKALENNLDFRRDKIAKVQFEEAWYYDMESQKMVKKVHSIMFAYEIYNSSGEIKGYKPAFKVYFSDNYNEK